MSRRRNLPTSHENISARTKIRRIKETYNATLEIHGGTEEQPEPAAVGLVETLATKFSKGLITSAMCKRPKLVENITAAVHKDACSIYENSTDTCSQKCCSLLYHGCDGQEIVHKST